MMLIQKQPLIHLSQPLSPAFSHRRHPSAPPTVIVQPTRTPGLLSLSKPVHKASPQRQLPSVQRQQQQQQQQQQKQSPRPRQAQPVRPALLNAAEITDKKNAVRPQKQTKGQSPSPQRHGKHARQPSPPLPPSESSQVEATNDPFLDFSASSTFKPTPPVLAPRPSGKLANRRQPQLAPMPALTVHTPTKAIPVPVAHRSSTQQISRSAPNASHSWDHICDDSNDEASFTPPSTPLRSRPQSSGPRTAPLSANPPGAYPLFDSSKRRFRNHKRSPSDHMFPMSSDDEAASGAEDLRALLDFVRSGSRPASTSTPPPQHKANNLDYIRSLSPASREQFFELEAQKEVAGYFASSSFQNSPSPDDLPAPLFA